MAYFLYPILFAIIPLIFLYSQNMGELRVRYIAPAGLIIVLSVAMAVYILAQILNLGYSAASPIVCGLIIVFYTPTAKFKRFFSKYFYQYIIEYAFYAFILFLAVIYSGFFTILFNIGTILVTTILIMSILAKAHGKNQQPTDNQDANKEPPPVCNIGDLDKPDVYDIVFDAYIGIDSLKYTTGFDNSLFYEELKKRGFQIPEKTFSNYNHTAASLPSMMNMDYTEGYLTENDFKSQSFISKNMRYRFYKMIDGKVPKIFKSIGYKYVITGEPLLDDDILTRFSSFTDAYTDRSQNIIKNGALLAFLSMTIIGGLFRQKKDMGDHSDYIHKILNAIPDIPKHQSPIFAFTHIWAPHTPYVFNADGTINEKFSTLNDLTSEDEETKTAYIGNIQHINTLILKTMDKLIEEIKKKGRKAVILLHSDHGLFKSDKSFTEFNILFAAYEYNIENKNIFPNDMLSLVNVYRYLFNGIFRQNFPILEDKFIYENWFIADYNFENITDKVNKEIYGDK